MNIYRILPSWAPMGGITLFQRVFLQKDAGERLLAHEAVHVKQQKRDGNWRFLWRYVTSAKWRVQYEAEAYATNLVAGEDLDDLARMLSGPLYLYPCSFDTAREAIVVAASQLWLGQVQPKQRERDEEVAGAQ